MRSCLRPVLFKSFLFRRINKLTAKRKYSKCDIIARHRRGAPYSKIPKELRMCPKGPIPKSPVRLIQNFFPFFSFLTPFCVPMLPPLLPAFFVLFPAVALVLGAVFLVRRYILFLFVWDFCIFSPPQPTLPSFATGYHAGS